MPSPQTPSSQLPLHAQVPGIRTPASGRSPSPRAGHRAHSPARSNDTNTTAGGSHQPGTRALAQAACWIMPLWTTCLHKYVPKVPQLLVHLLSAWALALQALHVPHSHSGPKTTAGTVCRPQPHSDIGPRSRAWKLQTTGHKGLPVTCLPSSARGLVSTQRNEEDFGITAKTSWGTASHTHKHPTPICAESTPA